ncbi:MAG: hypothetical protein GY928_02170 [Colwellia sp.]|nr:hypothetical protein [Colwellia sp.]
MKKIILSIIYPFWFFFSCNWIGNGMLFFVPFLAIRLLIGLFFPALLTKTGEVTFTGGFVVIVLGVFFGAYLTVLFIKIDDYLYDRYSEWNYKTEMEKETF